MSVRASGGWLRWFAFAGLLLPWAQACSAAVLEIPGNSWAAGASPSAGASHSAGAGGDPDSTAGASGSTSDGGVGDELGGAGGHVSAAGAGGSYDPAPPPLDLEDGLATVTQTPRSSFGALVATSDGDRTYVVESRRDVEAGPFGLPWRSRFRLAAYDRGALAWAFEAQPDDLIGDVVVHPSGEVTLSLERQAAATGANDLVRLTREGQVVGTTQLVSPLTAPETDYGPKDPQPLFAMKSALADATSAGWIRLLPEGEGVVVAFLSFAAPPGNTGPLSQRMALGLQVLDWQSKVYVERWARVVEGQHFAEPTAWAYDEFRWTEQAVRPFLARDESSGDLLVGRAWNQSRCQANVATFAEFTSGECMARAPGVQENELLPLAVTRFSATGARLGTHILRTDADAAEQVAFALAARAGELAVVGAVVRELPDGNKKTYPDPSGYVDYDGYIAVYDAEGNQLRHHDYDLGHGDVLAGMRWIDSGIVAVGAAGWDRWQGGMSISRGASPFFAWFSQDGSATSLRLLPLSDGSRHWNLHDVLVHDGSYIGYGFADAPMTHSADGGGAAARTFGSLWVQLK
ncbi:MAG: hypothetical protein ABW061_09260 [Polyangiaceae bacterium]